MKGIPFFRQFVPLLFAAISLGGVLPAQENPPPEKPPKIALVLSGGAALGFAHVGFLKVLEEVGIPIDMVVGNSMGSLVGALYAAGYSPGDIETLAAQINWGQTFLNQGPDQSESLLEERKPLFTLAFDRTGRGDSNGILPDQNITLLFSRLIYRVSMQEDFASLPLPFKAVAVDIANGKASPLERGVLYRAMRASMSIPLVFPPAPLNGTWFVDGGLLDNNPVDLALAWGADVVIDVDVGSFTPRNPAQIDSIEAITDQTLRLIQSTSILSNLVAGREDYLLAMDLSDFFWADFAKARQLIDRGEQLARSEESMSALAAIAAEIEKKRPLEKRDWRRNGTYQGLPDPVFTGVRLVSIGIDGALEDAQTYQDEFSQKYLNSLFDRFFALNVDFAKLESAIEIVRRRGNYQSVGYHLEQQRGGDYILTLTGVRSRERKNDVSFTLSGAYNLGAYAHLGLTEYMDFTFRDIFVPASVLSVQFSYDFSDTQGPGATLRYTRELSSLFSVRLEGEGAYYASTVHAFQPQWELSTFGFVNAGAQLLFTPADFFKMSLQYRYAPLWYEDNLRSDAAGPSYNGDLHLAGIEVNVDTVKVAQPLFFTFLYNLRWRFAVEFPFAGSRLYGGNTFPWYERLELYSRKVWTPQPNRNIVSDVSFASYRGELESRWTLYTPAGKNGIPGYSGVDILGRDTFIIGVTYLEEIAPLTNLTGMRNFCALTARGGNVWQRLDKGSQFLDWRGGIRTGLQTETPLGTVFLGPEFSFEGDFQFSIYFN
jgi:NTE family protein